MNSGAGLGNLLVLALPLLLLAFLMFSQRRRGREIQAFQDALAVGDKVVMTSGLYGTVIALDPVTATLEVAPGVQVRVDRRAVGMKQPEATTPNAEETE
ncbi:protein translocase subunit yajC [Knoellia remsis]|uniref:Protein translocase subunit yajC n=1 Tax=Knoellia remsis TaxID=407159 RepID=A0A2T0UFL4_9MICO|nr:preprotein translocase subunit YajC [Knoellia remsis]PRY56648.1 protein translocase subunit yajC [Knoellia remsis]